MKVSNWIFKYYNTFSWIISHIRIWIFISQISIFSLCVMWRPIHIKLFSSACLRTWFNEQKISWLCNVSLCCQSLAARIWTYFWEKNCQNSLDLKLQSRVSVDVFRSEYHMISHRKLLFYKLAYAQGLYWKVFFTLMTVDL